MKRLQRRWMLILAAALALALAPGSAALAEDTAGEAPDLVLGEALGDGGALALEDTLDSPVELTEDIEGIELKGIGELESEVSPVELGLQGEAPIADAEEAVVSGGTPAVNNYVGDFYIDENGVLTDYDGEAAIIDIPENVVEIGPGVFYGDEYITTVNIPYGVKRIGDGAFSSCKHLNSISIPNSVTSIGYGAFYECSSLKSISIPDSVKSLEDGDDRWWNGVFSNSGLQSIRLPKGLKRIPRYAFYDCWQLKSVVIPESVTTIGEYAFEAAGLESLTLPENLTTIGEYAFKINKISVLKIPNSVTSIGEGAFMGNALSSLTLSRNLKVIPKYAFWSGGNLTRHTATSLIIPEGVERIEDSALGGFSKVKELVIPASVKELGYPFDDWDKLERVEIKGNLSKANSCFGGLTTAVVSEGVTSIPDNLFKRCSELNKVSLPKSLKTINSYAFYECYALKNITIPENVKTIGAYAFGECGKLKTVTIKAARNGKCDRIIGQNAFYHCSSLTKITLPASVYEIQGNAFDSSGLKTVTFEVNGWGEGVRTIYSAAFQNCKSLKTLALPKSLNTIESYAFYDCDALVDVYLPGSVHKVGGYAFANCDMLETLYFPKSVTSIGETPFRVPSPYTPYKFKVLYVDKDSYAQRWAKKNNIKWQAADNLLPTVAYEASAKRMKKLTDQLLDELAKYPKDIRKGLKDDIFGSHGMPQPMTSTGKLLPKTAWNKLKEKYTEHIDKIGKDGSSYADLMKVKTPADLVKVVSKKYVFTKNKLTFTDKVKGVKHTYTVTLDTLSGQDASQTYLSIKDEKDNEYLGYISRISYRDIAAEMAALKAFGQVKIEEAKQAVKDDSISLIKGAVLYDELKKLAKGKAMVYIERKNRNLAQAVKEVKTLASLWIKLTNAFGKARDWKGVTIYKIPKKYKQAQDNFDSFFAEAEEWMAKAITRW